MRGWISLGAFIASAVFFGLETFEVALSDIALIPAGLFCMAIGFVVERLPDSV